MTNEGELSVDDMKVVAEKGIARIEASIDRILDQHSQTSRWLNATLLAINGAGALAAMNAADKLGAPAAVGACFVAGVLFAILTAVAIQWFASKSHRPQEAWLIYWRSVEHCGTRRHEDEEALVSRINAIDKLRWVAPAMGWMSALMFVAGVVLFGTVFHVASPADPRSCATLRSEMLSAKPKIAGAAATYAALGCERL